ncbi:uncharacterized protein LOC130629204 [Hydractinia symbiolongicarpus]|uniref:uncharacterized protein LOC130629204 n=1 Tax=Hydractinia symbiolongicarpus TaxID=13093 RepID=UPI00254AD3D4|nr:uncharacterized protein LOC130629204 [Hydractinia symbiolongicarpus]
MEVLDNFLYDTDHENQIIMLHPESQRIQNGVEKCVSMILDSVMAQNKRYKGHIIGAGSAFDALKVGKPNEYDFNFVLEAFVYGENFTVQPSGFNGQRNLWRTPAGSPAFKKIHLINDEFAAEWFGDGRVFNIGVKGKPEYILSQVGVKNEFVDLVNKSLKELTPPRGFSICGIVDMSGPAVSIDLIWFGRKFKELTVNVDISIAIEIPPHASGVKPLTIFKEDHFLYEVMLEYEKSGYCYTLVPFVSGDKPSNCWRVSTGYLESFIFSAFNRNSKKKGLLRVAKHIKSLIQLDKVDWNRITAFPEEYLCFEFSSYTLKHAVLHMVRDIPTLNFNTESVADRYIDMLLFLYKSVKKGYVENFFFPRHRIKVPDFDDCMFGFFSILSLIKEIFDKNQVNEQEKTTIWRKLEPIYQNITVYYEHWIVDEEYK